MFIERMCARLSTVVRQSSELNRQLCISDKIYAEKKVKVLGYGGTVGADFSRFDISQKAVWSADFRAKYGISKDDFVFGDICWVRRDKGSNELISAFRRLNKKDAWLVFVGDIYDEDPIDEELLEWAKASDRVIFTGRVLDVEHYIAGFDCLVHPSYREGLGMVLQEAGAMGVPSITTDIPGPKEFGVPGKTGLLVRSKDDNDLLEKMSWVYSDRGLLSTLSANVYDMTKERYERSKMVQRILDDRNDLYHTYIKK
jgi:glycosyltransferase involved in cell wall biosynthesis